MTARGVLGDSWLLYRRLLWRTVAIGAGVFVVLEIPGSLLGLVESRTAAALLAVTALVLSFAGLLLVQGALSNVVRDVHVVARERTVGGLCRDTRPRLGALVAGLTAPYMADALTVVYYCLTEPKTALLAEQQA